MRIGVIGGGVLGLSIAHYAQRAGHSVDVFERNGYLGGLACSYDYGQFIWDRFYHVMLPQDANLIELFRELGLEQDFRWRNTGTGYYAGGRTYSMSSSREMLRFPLLRPIDKLRMALGTLRAVRFANREDLYRLTAAEWLTRMFGRSNYRTFWRPLLRAKFGVYAERVAALTIQTALARLFGARSAVSRREAMGYVHGGYHRILDAFRTRLEAGGATIHLGARITRIGGSDDFAPVEAGAVHERRVTRASAGPVQYATHAANVAVVERVGACGIDCVLQSGLQGVHWYDRVVFTAPLAAALPVVSLPLREALETGAGNGQPTTYLGVVSLNVVLRKPLTPFYVLNIADERIPLTGLIEMTGLIDAAEETGGRTLAYLPRYVDSVDPLLALDDEGVCRELFDRGLRRLFPDLRPSDVVSMHVQRASYVQPLQFVTSDVPPPGNRVPFETGGFVLANTSLLECATLNNNEVVGLARQVASRL